MQHWSREMVSRQEEELQSSWCTKQDNNTSISERLGRNHVNIRQCWYVECEKYGAGKIIPRPAVLHKRSLPREISPRRIQLAWKFPLMWYSQDHAIATTTLQRHLNYDTFGAPSIKNPKTEYTDGHSSSIFQAYREQKKDFMVLAQTWQVWINVWASFWRAKALCLYFRLWWNYFCFSFL